MKNQKLLNIFHKIFSDYVNVDIFPKCFPFVSIFNINSYAALAFFRLKTKQKVNWYSTSPVMDKGNKNLKPELQSILTLDLIDTDYINSYKGILKGKGGIYSLVNTVNGKRYIGSAKDFYIRINEHLKYRNTSNVASFFYYFYFYTILN